jgi:hypothetical protein
MKGHDNRSETSSRRYNDMYACFFIGTRISDDQILIKSIYTIYTE